MDTKTELVSRFFGGKVTMADETKRLSVLIKASPIRFDQ